MNFKRLLFPLISFFLLNSLWAANNVKHPLPATPLLHELSVNTPNLISEINSICFFDPSFIVLGSETSLLVFDGELWVEYKTEEPPIVLKKSQSEALWASKNSLFVLKKQGQRINNRKLCSLQDSSSIRKVVTIEGNRIFVATSNSIYEVIDSGVEQLDSSKIGIELYSSNINAFYFKADEGYFRLNRSLILRSPFLPSSALKDTDLVGFYESEGATYAISHEWPWLWVVKESRAIASTYSLPIRSYETKILRVKNWGKWVFIETDSEGIFSLSMAPFEKESFPMNFLSIADFSPINNRKIAAISRTNLFEFNSIESAGFASDENGRLLQSNAVATYNGAVYCATNNGVFINSNEYPRIFHQLSETSGKYFRLLTSKFGLIAIGQRDLVVFNETRKVFKISAPPVDINKPIGFLNGPDESILVVCHSNEATCLIIGSKGIVQKTIKYPIKNIYPIRITLIDKQINILFSNQKAYTLSVINNSDPRLEPTNSADKSVEEMIWGQFQETNGLNDPTTKVLPLHIGDSTIVFKRYINNAIQKGVWLSTKKRDTSEFQKPKCFALIKAPTIINGTCVSNSKLWVSSPEGLMYFSTNEDRNANNGSSAYFSAFLVGENSQTDTLLYLVPIESFDKKLTLRSSYNKTLVIALYPSYFGQLNAFVSDNQYSFSTEAEEGKWSAWSNKNSYSIDLKKPKSFSLFFRSRNIASLEPLESSLRVNVLPQFYQQWYFILAFGIIGILGIMLALNWRRYHHAKERYMLESIINQRTEDLVREKEKTDNLLARVLPTDAASELKEKGKVNTQRFQMVTVLFSDIEGFTRITEHTNPENLIDQLDKFFLYFDSVVERFRIEKIKTIGDAYMCAGGIPKKNRTNPIEVVLAALEMMQYMKHITRTSISNEKIWDLRIGIDTGPVIAGVVGRNKLTYDIWGSTVNTASRMESSGEVGQINISGNTYMFVKEYFDCTYRGVIPIKNKGDIQMYFVNGIKANLSNNFEGLQPNHAFNVQLQLIRLGDLEEFILEKLEHGLPKNLYYHNLKHTVDVYTQVELIGRSENLGPEDILILRTAALFHDAGHMIDYSTHEEMSVKLVKEILPEFYYTQEQIDIVCQLIMATKMPPRPKNLLEQIICDADLDYLGRIDFIPVSNKLYQELHEHGKIGTLKEWNELQIKFIEGHQYFTNTARRLRNVNKNSQLAKLKAWIEKN